MHSSEGAPPPPPPAGPPLLLLLGRMVLRAHGPPQPAHASTSAQVVSQPRPGSEEVPPALEAQLVEHVNALWSDHAPLCIEVSLAPDCSDCLSARRAAPLLLERWTMTALPNKPASAPSFSCAQWLVSALRSALHFSQLAAWRATLAAQPAPRRKLSRETCNIKKLEANLDDELSVDEDLRHLNIIYTIRTDKQTNHDFSKQPVDHTFPLTHIGDNTFLKVTLQSLPRIDEIPTVKCHCPKRRPSKDNDEVINKLNDLTIGSKLELGAINNIQCRRLSVKHDCTEFIYTDESGLVDDRMHTPCSENGKHKCNCDDESDTQNPKSSTSVRQETKKIDEKRLKEIAKYKRRLRKESKLKKLCDSTSSECERSKETHTSIPILQASRFDRFRAIGCYRNQTYLTLPATRIEYKSPFVETVTLPPAEFKKTNTIATQTDEITCDCGSVLKCEKCDGGPMRSQTHDPADVGNGRAISKKHKCDKPSISSKCDIQLINDSPGKDEDSIIKRPKLRRLFPLVDRIEKIVSDRFCLNPPKDVKPNPEKDIEVLHLKKDDSVFSTPKTEPKRQKTFSISEDDYYLYEKSDYGTFDRCELESPNEITDTFKFPEAKQQKTSSNSTPNNSLTSTLSSNDNTPDEKAQWNFNKSPNLPQTCLGLPQDSLVSPQNGLALPRSSSQGCPNSNTFDGCKNGQELVPSPWETERFRNRFDSAASMVFTRSGLPLTSSPAPLRRGNASFDFDDTINGVSGIKSALFLPPPPSPVPVPDTPPSPLSPSVTTPPPLTRSRRDRKETAKIIYKPSRCLLGSFEECLLKGRLQPSAAVRGFAAALAAAGAYCSPHARLPVAVYYFPQSHAHAPYMGHIELGPAGYRVPPAGTIQLSLFNPHGSLVKMFRVVYELSAMPPRTRTFLRQRTYCVPARGAAAPEPRQLRYLIHLRFMTSKSGKLYLHTDIRLIVSRKADIDTATAHSTIMRPMSTNHNNDNQSPNHNADDSTNRSDSSSRSPNRVFGGCDNYESKMRELGYENQDGVAYELRSFTYAPDNPKYSPR